jgi:hypothetical protein
MKSKITSILLTALFVCAFSGAIKSQTTCDLTINGASQEGATYTVSFNVIYYPNLVYITVNWTSPISVNYGFNNDVAVNLDVNPDCSQCWILVAKVTKTYQGNSITYTGYSSLMSSTEYYAGSIPVTVHIP